MGLREIQGVVELGAPRTMAGWWWPPAAMAAWRGHGAAWDCRGWRRRVRGGQIRPGSRRTSPVEGELSYAMAMAGCCKEEEEAVRREGEGGEEGRGEEEGRPTVVARLLAGSRRLAGVAGGAAVEELH